MSGSIIKAAKADAKIYVTKGGFESLIKISTPSGNMSVNATGYATKHHINWTPDGLQINTKNAHVCIDEKELFEKGYPVRNNNQEISLTGHKIDVADSSEIIKNYVVKENFPDETLGLIVLILGDRL